MSRLEHLIAEYCPDGVEFAKLGEKVTIMRGASPRPINSYITTDEDGINWIKIGDVEQNAKYVTQTQQRITSVGAKKSRLLKKGDFVLSNSMSFGRPYILAIDGCIHDGWIAISNIEEVYNADFLYYLLNSKTVQDYWEKVVPIGTIRNLNADIVRSTPVPVPPLPIQIEIARILDSFAESTTNLKTELAAEFVARKKQYEYYRNFLLSFSESREVMKWCYLGDIAQYSKTRIAANSLTGNTYVGVDNLLTDKGGKTLSTYVPTTGNLTEYRTSDILIGNIRPYLKKIWLADNSGGTNGDVLVVRITDKGVTPRYLYYLLSSDNFFDYNMQHAKGAKMPRGSKDAVMRYEVPLPSLEEQNRIVDILDKFEALTAEITDRLPAEIEARQKQYEYCRDKLMTFKEKIA